MFNKPKLTGTLLVVLLNITHTKKNYVHDNILNYGKRMYNFSLLNGTFK